MTNAGRIQVGGGGGSAAVEFWIVYYKGSEIEKNIDKRDLEVGHVPQEFEGLDWPQTCYNTRYQGAYFYTK